MEESQESNNLTYSANEAESYVEFKKRPVNIAMEQYSFRKKIKELLESGELKKDFSVVDLACGSGTYTRILREYTAGEIVGIDLSQEMVNTAIDLEKDMNTQITYIQGDCLSDLSSKLNKKFDVVNACWLYNYAPTEEILKESIKNAKSLLNDNGILMGVTLNFNLKPDSWKVSESYGSSNVPKNRNYNREKLENGEPLVFVLFEPNNFCEPFKFEVDNYFYYDYTYKNAFNEAGFKVTMQPFEIDPENYSADYEKIIDIYGVVFVAKSN